MDSYVVIRSDLIESPDEAWAYYRAKLVGAQQIQIKTSTITIQFPGDEIHLFTEKTKIGQTPSPDKLVRRPNSTEVRYFSRARAKLLDRVVPTLQRAVGSVSAKEPGATLVFGPVD